jgi:hypothetical protein
MNKAAKLTPAGERLVFGLSGGEVFLDLEQLVEVIRHGVSLGATLTCVTNAYWATSDARGQAIIERVREAGLGYMAASTSRYHQRFVPIEHVKRALGLARTAGIRTSLKIAYSVADQKEGLVDRWALFETRRRASDGRLPPHARTADRPLPLFLTDDSRRRGRVHLLHARRIQAAAASRQCA